MKPSDRMHALISTSSRIEKEQILIDAFMNEEWEFFQGIKLCLNQLVTFGVKKVAEILEDDDVPSTFTFDDFLHLAHKLRRRKLTGHAARDAIHDAASRCDVENWNGFYRRILLKDLGVGVDAKTINKMMKKLSVSDERANEFFITVFECQLAQDGEDEKHRKKLRGKKLIDTKLDGMRIIAAMDKEMNIVQMFSRNGQTIDTFPEINAALLSILEHLPGSIVLDGEVISPKGFQHLMTLVKRKNAHPDTALVKYALFDIIPLQDFRLGYCAKSQSDRHLALEATQSLLATHTDHRIYIVPKVEIDLDTAEGQETFAELNRRTIADGYEGLMIKDPSAPYECKRTTAWLKKKPTIEVTLEIIGVEPGQEGKYAHTLGALVCQGIDNGLKINSNVAGGISDELRDKLWKERENLIGMIVEVIADKVTLEEGAETYSLRFPRLKGFRGRIPGEKL